ncbi:hypothetical protein [Burkholderia sp. PU8-34]
MGIIFLLKPLNLIMSKYAERKWLVAQPRKINTLSKGCINRSLNYRDRADVCAATEARTTIEIRSQFVAHDESINVKTLGIERDASLMWPSNPARQTSSESDKSIGIKS